MGGAYTDGLLTTVVYVNGAGLIKVGGAAGGGINFTSPLTAVANGSSGNVDLGISAAALTGVIPATPSTVVERDSGGRGFFVGLNVGAGSLVNCGALTFSAVEGNPGLAQAQENGTGNTTGAEMAIQAQQGQGQTGVANNTDGGALALSGGDPGAGGSGAGGGQGALLLTGGYIIASATYPPAGGSDGSVTVTGVSIILQFQDGGGLHTLLAIDNSGIHVGASGGKVGLYGATPVVQASRAGQLTDSTGGTPGTTLAAISAGTLYAQADMVAVKNALASLSSKYDALELAIHNLGLTA